MAEIDKFENREQMKGYAMALNDLRELIVELEKRLINNALDKVV